MSKTIKSFIKLILDRVAPAVLHRRFIRIMSPKEPELSILSVLCNRGDIAIDVGANRGLYTHHLLRIGARVIAFEPLPAMSAILKQHYPKTIQLHEIALSSEPGALEIRFPKDTYSWATIEPANALDSTDPHNVVTRNVPVRTLDSYGIDGVGLIKIDVEGHEEDVLAGGFETIRRCKPNIIVEIEERHKSGSVFRVRDKMRTLDYEGFFLDGNGLRSMMDFSIDRDQVRANVNLAGKVGRYINNFIFIPTDRAASVRAGIERILGS